jgi:hypothetical protein
MNSWSARRRFIYGGSVVIVVALIFGTVFWKLFYRPPTCSDGFKNGDETGVDCGGSCQRICTSDALAPVVLWSKVFNISGDVYSAVAYVENPNINSKNQNAKYEFRIYDENGKQITVKDGSTSIPKGKKFAVFETGLVLKGLKPKSSDFVFTSFAPWEKDLEKDPDISINYGTLTSTTSPKISGSITNNSSNSVSELEIDVFILDNNENAVAASRSFIDNLSPKTTQDFVFTWPKPLNLGVEACANPADIAVDLDRSGSMRSEAANPPEPFTTVISTAENFIKNLTSNDQVAVFSFGNNSKIENMLSDKNAALLAVSNLNLGTSTEQTNIFSGLSDSFSELTSQRAISGNKKVIVLLTDGVPTEPKDTNIPDNPIISAQKVANDIKNAGIEIYTIGLGQNVNEGFLRSISTDDAHYFPAPNKETLSGIYTKIGTSICSKKPNVITVIYRII